MREKTTSGMISNWLLSQKRAQRVVSREKLAGKVESLFLDSRRHARQRSSPIAGSGSLRQQAATIAVVSKKKKKRIDQMQENADLAILRTYFGELVVFQIQVFET